MMGKAVVETVQAIPYSRLRFERAAQIGAWHVSAHPWWPAASAARQAGHKGAPARTFQPRQPAVSDGRQAVSSS